MDPNTAIGLASTIIDAIGFSRTLIQELPVSSRQTFPKAKLDEACMRLKEFLQKLPEAEATFDHPEIQCNHDDPWIPISKALRQFLEQLLTYLDQFRSAETGLTRAVWAAVPWSASPKKSRNLIESLENIQNEVTLVLTQNSL